MLYNLFHPFFKAFWLIYSFFITRWVMHLLIFFNAVLLEIMQIQTRWVCLCLLHMCVFSGWACIESTVQPIWLSKLRNPWKLFPATIWFPRTVILNSILFTYCVLQAMLPQSGFTESKSVVLVSQGPQRNLRRNPWSKGKPIIFWSTRWDRKKKSLYGDHQ